MATKGYSFQDDEKTIIDIDIYMDTEKCTVFFFLKYFFFF